MGKKSHKCMPFMCGACKHGFGTQDAAKMHAQYAHPNAEGIGIYRMVTQVDGKDFEPSLAERAVDAELALAMGEPTDDAWLLGK